MKISSKSILSPGRAGSSRDPPSSLSTSLSRRLRNSRSIKGGASPAMFPATGKRRGSGFDNPEPSSPKVTCIGQVRVKTKKKHIKRTLSRRHSAGEVSFRKLQHSGDGFSGQNQHPNQEFLPGQRNNQRWVHLPLTICEALREFSCMFPCRSSCSSTPATEKEEKTAAGSVDGNRQGSCSAVFARWLVAMQDGDGGERVAGAVAVSGAGDDDDDDEDEVRNSRRHVFQDLEIVNDCIQGSKDEARVSICVPPKNALLLMRCRSDPMKMEALTNRFWEPSVGKNEEGDEEIVEEEDEIEEKRDIVAQEDLQFQKEEKVMDLDEIHEVNDQEHRDLQEVVIDQEKVETNLETEMKQSIQEEEDQEQSIESNEKEDQEQSIETNAKEAEEEEDQEQSMETNDEDEEEEGMFLGFLFEENADEDQKFQENDESDSDMEDAKEELFEEDEDVQENRTEESTSNIENEEEMATEFTEKSETPEETHEEEVVIESKKAENEVLERESEVKEERESITSVLPECLLLMMCEPKLSMEVSKETWVCSTDFIRQPSGRKKPPPPPPRVKSVNGQSESNTAVAQYQPSRSSCSLPAPQSMTAMLEQKLVSSVGFEPFVLTRCKSEPMRTTAAKLISESCFWKNRKLEPLGIGLAGLGF